MPLLRLQQPCPRRASTRKRGAMRLLADLAHEARLLPGTRADLDLLRRRHALADGPGDRRSGHRRRQRPLDAGRRHRDYARGQSQFGRGRRASPTSPPPASTACRSACRASTTRRLAFLGRAHSAREGFRALEIAQKHFRPGQLRPDLRASRRHRGELVGDTCPGAERSAPAHLSLYQLTIEPGTRFAAHGREAANSSRSTRTLRQRFTS